MPKELKRRTVSRDEVLAVLARWLAAQETVCRSRQERITISYDSQGRITAVKVDPPAVRLA